MISKEWNYYFEREFELFRCRLEGKSIRIQNLLKRIDAISKDVGAITTKWEDIYIIEDLQALKSLSTYLSLTGIDFNNKLFIKFYLKGGELAIYRVDFDDNHIVKPILRCTQTYVSKDLQEDEHLHELNRNHILHTGKLSTNFKDWSVIFDSYEDKELYQFDNPILVQNLNINDFPYQIRQRSYFELIKKYTTPQLNFKYGSTVEGTTTLNGIRLAYYIPKLSD